MNTKYLSTKIKIGGGLAIAAVVTTLSFAGGTVSAESNSYKYDAYPASQTAQTPAYDHMTSQKAVDLRVGLNNLLREHVTSSLNVTHALAGNEPANVVDGAKAAQYANSEALAAAVGSIYGGAAQVQFLTLFNRHIVASNEYAMAVGAGDRSAADAANVELREYLEDLSNFFVSAIPGLKYNEIYGFLNEHEELVNKSTDAYKAGDYVQAFQMEREALKQISRAADALSAGIIATNPDKF